MNRNLFVRQATAFAVGGHLEGPVRTVIEPQACLSLAGVGSSGFSETQDFICEGISFRSAESQITGLPSRQTSGPINGDTTYVTMIRTSIQDLNILNTITAKALHARLVISAQVPNEPVEGLGPFPQFNFFGTTIDDLRIAGARFELPQSLRVIPSKLNVRKNGHPFKALLERLESTYMASNGVRLVTSLIVDDQRSDQNFNSDAIANNIRVASNAAAEIQLAEEASTKGEIDESKKQEKIREAKGKATKELIPNETRPIEVEGFGKVYVAELQYHPYSSCLNMLRVEVQCGAIEGHVQIAAMEGGGVCWPRENT